MPTGYTYIMGSHTGVLYIGVTSKLDSRVRKHKRGAYEGFSKTYGCTRLLYFECFDDIRDAINRETQLKGWRREKKLALIRKRNPEFKDLAEKIDWKFITPHERMNPTLPIHAFILAGGQSSRMGADKALLEFRGQPMIATAAATLRQFCAHVSIAGNRDDLATYAPIAHETRTGEGPAAGIEAGLTHSESDWTLFTPVDTPLLPAPFLRAWAEAVLQRPHTKASYIRCGEDIHPALCLIHHTATPQITAAVEAGQRRVRTLLEQLPGIWIAEATLFATDAEGRLWLTNINTPEDLAAAEKLFAA